MWDVALRRWAGDPVELPRGVAWVGFDAKGRLVALSGDDRITVFDPPRGTRRLSISPTAGTWGTPAISPDGTLLAVGEEGAVAIVTLATGSVDLRKLAVAGTPISVAWTPDAETLVVDDARGGLHLIDAATGAERSPMPRSKPAWTQQPSPTS